MPSRKNNAERGLGRSAERTETGLYNQRMGRNRLQADDQENVHNERHATPDAKEQPDETMESFSKLDKETRARKDLGKGNKGSRSGE